MKKTIVIVGLLALTCVTLAQGGGGQGRRFGMRFAGGGMGMLVNRADVQRELGISEDQKTKLRELREKMQAERESQMESFRTNGGPPDREAMMKAFREMEEKSTKALGEILTADQVKRLKELSLQRAGNRALMRPDVQKELGLTEDQVKKIEELQNKQQEASRSIFEKVQNGEVDRSEVRELMEKNNRIMDEELAKVLTEAQRAKLKEMSGKPFTFDPDEERPRRDGR